MDCFKNQGFENDGFENDGFENDGFEVEICLVLATESAVLGSPYGENAEIQFLPLRQQSTKLFCTEIEVYKYMHIYLWTALRIVVFERGICGF